ncbi:MAG: HAD family hydrolase, partial [Fusobacteriaceae bacterium]|nr:HAD family hydrolase [Fusobacteriaceae bacterium]
MGKLSAKKCFLLDMDGTIYLGNEMIPGADKFLEALTAHGVRYIFLTNNSSKSKVVYLEKLRKMKLPATIDNIFTSGEATTVYLNREKPGARIFLLGTPALEEEFVKSGFTLVRERNEHPDYVVLGFDTTLTYEKLWIGCDYIMDGVPYIAT